MDMDASKNEYLRSKGITKALKKGVTRVFYNQCQFFAHLRSHSITTVDSSEVMLMPLPSGMKREHYTQLDRVFKALMEVMFIRGVHIMDWLRDKKIAWNTMVNFNTQKANAIVDIVGRYADNCLPANRYENNRQDNPIQFEDSRRRSRQAHANHAKPSKFRIALSESRAEREDDSRLTNDIAFVDCGPGLNNYVAESSDMSSPRRAKSNASPSELPSANAAKDTVERPAVSRPNSLWRSVSRRYDKLREKSRDAVPKSSEDRTELSTSSSINPTGPRVLTIRSPKSLNLSTILQRTSQNDAVDRKKIVNDGENEVSSSPETPSSVASVSSTKDTPILLSTQRDSPSSEKSNTPTDSKNGSSSIAPLTADKTKSLSTPNLLTQTFSEQMTLHGRIVFQNGRKYIIRHVPKSKYRTILPGANFRSPASLSPTVAGPQPVALSKVTQSTKPVSILPKIVPKTTNPPPKLVKLLPKVQAPTSTKVDLRRILSRNVTVRPNSENQIIASRLTKNQISLVCKYRESMLKDLHRASRQELDAYVQHLRGISDEYSKAMGLDSDSVMSTNAKTIKYFEKLAAARLPPKDPSEERPVANSEDSFERSAKEWELRIKDADRQRRCATCEKKVKPATYVVGISGPAVDESVFCHCYNNVCYKCNANQGSLMQLKSHVKWHKGEKPFSCPDCSIIFPSSTELEIHVWTTCFHPMSRYIYGCGVCQVEGMLDMEAVAKHFLLLHTRRRIICSECKMEYTEKNPTYTDLTKHFVEHHPDIESISEPKRLVVCNLKQCIIRPEHFRAHLSDHLGVLKWIYYKCPFCSMITQGTGRNKTMIREHLVENHMDRMHEVVSAESLQRVLDRIKRITTNCVTDPQHSPQTRKNSTTSANEACPPVSNADTTGPMIINARTITPASFEHGSESSEEQLEYEDLTVPKILEVRSEAVGEFESDGAPGNDFALQIIAVESMADGTPESPAMGSEASDAVSQQSACDELTALSDDAGESVPLEMCSLPIKDANEDLDTDADSKTEASVRSASDVDDKKYSHEQYDSSEKSDASEQYQKTRIASPATRKRLLQKPWRIALNSPSSADTAPVVYNCHLCGEMINTCWSVIRNHFTSRHSGEYSISVVSPKIPRISTDYIDGGYREESGASQRKVEASQVSPGSKRRRRWGPKKYLDRPGSPSLGLCVRPETVQEVEGSFRCKKCDEPFKDRAVLRDHIASSHRIKGQYLICLECGENFVVVPSLQMHLKALHGIQDPITYLSQNTAYAPDVLDDVEELEKATESNQCYVCMAVFEDKAAVDKHIRVHGMAFLKRKRFEAQKALKSCEKKGEPPDNNATSDGKAVTKNNPTDAPGTTGES